MSSDTIGIIVFIGGYSLVGYVFIGALIAQCIFDPYFNSSRVGSDQEKARLILVGIFWPLFLVWLVFYLIYWVFSRAFFGRGN